MSSDLTMWVGWEIQEGEVLTDRERWAAAAPKMSMALAAQGGTCPKCGSVRTNDGWCSTCFLRGLR